MVYWLKFWTARDIQSAKLYPEEVVRTSQNGVLWSIGTSPTNVLTMSSTNILRTLIYDVLGTFQWNVLKTSPYCPICNTNGRHLLTSWGRLLQTLSHTLIFNSKVRVLPTSRGLPKDVLVWFYQWVKKPPRDKDFCIWS